MRKKAQEKESVKITRALKQSSSIESDIVSPDFGGNIIAKKARRQADRERDSPSNTLK